MSMYMLGQACICVSVCVYVCVSKSQSATRKPHPSQPCLWNMKEEEGGSCFQNGKLWNRVGAFFLSFFFPCRWLFFYIYLPSRRPVLSPITHPPFYTLVWPFFQLPLSHSGVDVNPVALSRLPAAPNNVHLYFMPREQFSCLFLDECCEMFCRGRII